MRIRSAEVSDVPALLAIEHRSASAAHWTPEQYIKLVQSELVQSAIVLVAEEANQLLGFICAKSILPEWEIENIVVDAAFLRRGVASYLLRRLIDRAVHEKASAILLEVRESNLPARRLYEKHGFTAQHRRSIYYRNPPEDAVLYALNFADA